MTPVTPHADKNAGDSPVQNSKASRRGVAQAVSGSMLGLTFAFSVLIGFAIGYGLDRLFHTGPFLMLASSCSGWLPGYSTLSAQ